MVYLISNLLNKRIVRKMRKSFANRNNLNALSTVKFPTFAFGYASSTRIVIKSDGMTDRKSIRNQLLRYVIAIYLRSYIMCPVLASGMAKKKLMKRSVIKNRSIIRFNTNNAFKLGLANAT